MTEAAFQRIVQRTWERMRADDATVTREYVEAGRPLGSMRLIRQMGGGGKRKGRARA